MNYSFKNKTHSTETVEMEDEGTGSNGLCGETEKYGSHPGLSSITALCEKLGNPQEELKFIHIAGTNGKGSVTAF